MAQIGDDKMQVVPTLKQIIIITDGHSNVGVNPVVVAQESYNQGIVVNVIGVIDSGSMSDHGAREVRNIAEAGGGLSRIISSRILTHTVQMVTRQAMNVTLQQVVQTKLQQLIGNRSLDLLHPEERGRIIEVIEDIGEESTLQVVLLIDISASMKEKLPAIETAIRELGISIESRVGRSELQVITYPGLSNAAEVTVPWTNDSRKLTDFLVTLQTRGKTPTGPALQKAIQAFTVALEDESFISVRNQPSSTFWGDYAGY